MLLFKRVITTCLCFGPLFLFFFFAACVIGGAVSGFVAGYQNPAGAAEAGERAGALFVENKVHPESEYLRVGRY